MAGGIDFNRGKFKELVLYLAQISEHEGDEGFGMVKLNKLLYRADFEAYRLLGRSITGEVYEKQEYGPVARDLPIILDELAAAGRLRWQLVPRGDYTRKVPSMIEGPEAEPDLRVFSPDEWAIVERARSELATHGGKSASDWSHEESVGWNVVPEYGQPIQYASTFFSTKPIPREDLERARQFVRDRGWVEDTA